MEIKETVKIPEQVIPQATVAKTYKKKVIKTETQSADSLPVISSTPVPDTKTDDNSSSNS